MFKVNTYKTKYKNLLLVVAHDKKGRYDTYLAKYDKNNRDLLMYNFDIRQKKGKKIIKELRK